MRKRFIQNLLKLARKDPNVYLIVGDLGFSVVEPFKQEFPGRFINVGVAEQNMIGVASGLAMAGKKVFVYSIIPFVTMRCFEQIRNDLCYQNLPVRIVGVGTGFSYGTAGATHHAIEDIAIMRSLPNMTVISPSSFREIDELFFQANNLPGPVYFRFSKGKSFANYPDNVDVKLGKMIEILPNNKNLIFTTGDSLGLGFDVCNKLKEYGINIGLVSVPTIKPLDFSFVFFKDNLQSIFTIEEHNVIGGLGESFSSFICHNFKKTILFKSFGIPDKYCSRLGSKNYLNKQVGLDVEGISNELLNKLKDNIFKKNDIHIEMIT